LPPVLCSTFPRLIWQPTVSVYNVSRGSEDCLSDCFSFFRAPLCLAFQAYGRARLCPQLCCVQCRLMGYTSQPPRLSVELASTQPDLGVRHKFRFFFFSLYFGLFTLFLPWCHLFASWCLPFFSLIDCRILNVVISQLSVLCHGSIPYTCWILLPLLSPLRASVNPQPDFTFYFFRFLARAVLFSQPDLIGPFSCPSPNCVIPFLPPCLPELVLLLALLCFSPFVFHLSHFISVLFYWVQLLIFEFPCLVQQVDILHFRIQSSLPSLLVHCVFAHNFFVR